MNTTSLKLIGYDLIGPDPAWHLPADTHAFHETIVILKGVIHVKILGCTHVYETGDVLHYPPGIAHEESSDKKDPCQLVFFAWQGKTGPLPYAVRDVKGRIRLLAQWAIEEKRAAYPKSGPYAASLLGAILEEYVRIATFREDALVSKVRVYLENRLADKITLDDLAGAAGMSKYHFLRLFKGSAGATPMDYLRGRRLEKARDLVLTTGLPLKDIAARVGFADEYHLSSLFRKYLKKPPGYFRKRR